MKQKSTGKYLCAKIMKKEDIMQAQQVDHICNEYRILSSIRHPFIVRPESLRSASKDSPRMQGTFISSWNTCREESSSRTLERKACSSPTRLRIFPSILDFMPHMWSPSSNISTLNTLSIETLNQKIYSSGLMDTLNSRTSDSQRLWRAEHLPYAAHLNTSPQKS